MLKRFAIVLAGLGLLSACGGGEFAKLANEGADKVCACKDMACVEAAEKDLRTQMEKLSEGKTEEQLIKENASDLESIMNADTRAEACKKALAPKDEAGEVK